MANEELYINEVNESEPETAIMAVSEPSTESNSGWGEVAAKAAGVAVIGGTAYLVKKYVAPKVKAKLADWKQERRFLKEQKKLYRERKTARLAAPAKPAETPVEVVQETPETKPTEES